jgi:hypothetical protein
MDYKKNDMIMFNKPNITPTVFKVSCLFYFNFFLKNEALATNVSSF